MKKIILLVFVSMLFSSCMYSVTRLPNGCKYYHVKHPNKGRKYYNFNKF